MPVVGCTPSTRGNILNSSDLNHFLVQPEILKVLPRVLGLALTSCNLICNYLIIKT